MTIKKQLHTIAEEISEAMSIKYNTKEDFKEIIREINL